MFNASRLSLARKRRGFTKKRLAENVGLSVRIVSAYEAGEKEPSSSTLDRVSHVLRFPRSFFAGDDLEFPNLTAVSFRSLAAMTASQRDAAVAAATLAVELNSWIESNFNLPIPDLPDLSGHEPATAAEILRATWGLGERPIRNMVHLLEAHGVRVYSLAEDCHEVDAFSFWRDGVPFVFLNTMKSAERGRLDAAHELGHLLLHREGMPEGRSAEKEAQAFAGAVLMPRASVVAAAPIVPTVSRLVELKSRWDVSATALAHRLHALGLVTDWHYRTLCVQMAALGYRTHEPQPIARETSQVLAKVFEQLRNEGIGKAEIADRLHVPLTDLEALVFGLVMLRVDGTGRSSEARSPDLRVIIGREQQDDARP